MRNRVAALAALVAAAPLVAACGPAGSGGSGGSEPRVVASFYPLEYVAQRVAGGHAQVTNLTSPGVEPHDLELGVRQTAEVVEADLAVYQKGFQPAVDEALEQEGPEHVVDAAEVVRLADEPEHEPDDGAAAHGAHGPEEEHNDHDHGGSDPHFWLDPQHLADVAAAFTDELVEVDPEHESAYRDNLAALQRDLDRLDQDLSEGLADCRTRTVVVSHDAFGYLGSAYDLEMVPIAGLSPDAEPTPGHIQDLHELIRSDGITTVFSETLASPKMSETIAADLGIETAVLDPIEGLGDATAGEDYLSLMRRNLDALRTANGCS